MSVDVYGNLLSAMALLLVSTFVVPFIAGKRKLAGWINAAFVSLAGVILLNISFSVLFDVTALMPIGAAGFSGLFESNAIVFGSKKLYFLIDQFSAFFMAIIAFMSILCAFYSIEYMEHYPDYSLRSYYLNYPLFILGMLGIVTVDDLSVGFTAAWQIMTVASFFLVRFEHRKQENVKSALKYLVLMEIAWVIILAAQFAVSGSVMFDSIHSLTMKMGSMTTGMVVLIYLMLFIGFGFKAAIFPLGQLWLPDAHSVAPSPISAMLSGVMIKTGIYGLIRTFFWMVPQGIGVSISYVIVFSGILIGLIGTITLFIGTSQALKQYDAKRLHAYHSIGQIGYIVLGIGAALVMLAYQQEEVLKTLSMVALVGALYHTLNHTVFKGLLFLTSGSVLYATNSKDLNKLGGLINLTPMTAFLGGIASLSIAGMPMFSGFMSKWSIISTSLLGGKYIMIFAVFGVVALFTSALTLASYVKFFGMTFTSSGSEWNITKKIKEVPTGMLVPKFILGALCLIQGLLPFVYYSFFISILQNSEGSIMALMLKGTNIKQMISSSFAGVVISMPGLGGRPLAAAIPLLIGIVLVFAAVMAVLFRRSGGSTERKADIWLCGYQDLNDLNRYRSASMYSALKKVLWWAGGNVKK